MWPFLYPTCLLSPSGQGYYKLLMFPCGFHIKPYKPSCLHAIDHFLHIWLELPKGSGLFHRLRKAHSHMTPNTKLFKLRCTDMRFLVKLVTRMVFGCAESEHESLSNKPVLKL